MIEDLGSTNGTFVAGRRIRRSTLTSGDRLQIGRECIFRFAVVDETEEELQRRLYESSMRDPLTSLANRRCFVDRLATEVAHAQREDRTLGLLMIDIDDFKVINDSFGHAAGDHVLRAIALRGAKLLRAGDVFARYGGDELAVIARDANKGEAIALAERLRQAVADLRVEVGGGSVTFTVSIGVAARSEARENDPLALFSRADARLRAAKVAGRNCVRSDD